MNHPDRAAARKHLKRENLRYGQALVELPHSEWPEIALRMPHPPLRVWRSRDYLVQLYPAPAPCIGRLCVNLTMVDGAGHWAERLPWEELQRVKSECGYGDRDAVEVFPRDGDVVNVANMRHLWLMAEPLPFAWRAP